MKISVRWLNEYLDPANVTAEGAEIALTDAGFPIEEAIELPNGDVMLDVEVTSNRGDCISHIGLAREVAAVTGRRLRLPAIPEIRPAAAEVATAHISQLVRLDNRVPDLCRLFTLRIIRGVKVGPSPAWLADALLAVGQRPINNVVDVTNFVLFEFGQPLHAFDLQRVRRKGAGPAEVIVRSATAGEKLTLLDGRDVSLAPGDLVVADAAGPVSLAGIMGGRGTEVLDSSTDILLEAATWDPLTIRRTGRRLQVSSDSSYRFERMVDPRTIDAAARRAADLLVRLGGSGAALAPGVLEAGAVFAPKTRVSLRPARCRDILGVDLAAAEMARALRAHDIDVAATDEDSPLECVMPAHRPDLEREIDLIEEVARTNGLARVPIIEKLPVRVAAPQTSERAMAELAGALTGLGFFETITFSFVSPKQAAPFLPRGLGTLELCDERRKADPVLRPSVLPSLLACRRSNQDAGVHADGGVRLFEVASVFAQTPGPAKVGGTPAPGKEIETRVLALLADAVSPEGASKGFDARQSSFRLMRGVIEAVLRTLGGSHVRAEFVRADLPFTGLDAAATAEVVLYAGDSRARRLGVCGFIAPEVQQSYDLVAPCVAAELDLGAMLALYPPRSLAASLPQFPGIERDLSLIVPETTDWAAIDSMIGGAGLERLDGWEFITAYRGAYRDSASAEHNLARLGKKAVTVRLRFRDPSRTLRHQEVDPQVATIVRLASSRFGAELRM